MKAVARERHAENTTYTAISVPILGDAGFIVQPNARRRCRTVGEAGNVGL